MFDVGSIFAKLDIGWDGDLDTHDFNRDGELTSEDCPFDFGSPSAKLWWRNVMEPYASSNIEPEWVDKYGDKLAGGYKGKPLVPGEIDKSSGNLEFFRDKIRITQGLSYVSSTKIAFKVLQTKL